MAHAQVAHVEKISQFKGVVNVSFTLIGIKIWALLLNKQKGISQNHWKPTSEMESFTLLVDYFQKFSMGYEISLPDQRIIIQNIVVTNFQNVQVSSE